MIFSLSAVTSSSASDPCCLVQNKNNINNKIVFCGRGNFYRAGFHPACSYGLKSQGESLNHYLFEVLKHYVWIVILGRFRRGSNGIVKKAIGLISKKKKQLCTWIVLFRIKFLCRPYNNYDVKWPNFKCNWERGRQCDKFYHLCLNSDTKKFERMRSLFFNEVFIDVAFVRSWRSPIKTTKRQEATARAKRRS